MALGFREPSPTTVGKRRIPFVPDAAGLVTQLSAPG